MDVSEIEASLTFLAVQRKVAASTQNQALSALVFLCRHVLHQDTYINSWIRIKVWLFSSGVPIVILNPPPV
jgi:Phage integrase, N-terminal SAM-like domain